MFESLLAAGVSDPGAPRWGAVRHAPRECDRALSGTARRWLRGLPRGVWPLHLCERHPRLANRVAFGWQDRQRTGALLDDLLHDRRGGRHGFAPEVVLELQRLRQHLQAPEAAGAGVAETRWQALQHSLRGGLRRAVGRAGRAGHGD